MINAFLRVQKHFPTVNLDLGLSLKFQATDPGSSLRPGLERTVLVGRADNAFFP